jgi:hypothetical protein
MVTINVACKLNQGYAVSAPVEETPIEDTPVSIEDQSSVIAAEESIESNAFVEEDIPNIKITQKIKKKPFQLEEEYNPLLAQAIPEPPPTEVDIFDYSEIEDIIVDDTPEDPIQVITYNETKQEESKTPIPPKEVSPIIEEKAESEHKKLSLIIGSIAALLILGGGAFLFFQTEDPEIIPVPLSSDHAPVEQNVEKSSQDASTHELAQIENEEPLLTISRPAGEQNAESEPVELIEVANAEPAIEIPIEPEPVEPILPMGSILLDSTPSGASVLVNGINKGTTPTTVEQLQFGPYAIEFKLEGYASKILEVSVDS